jgi:putative transposase
MPRRLRDSHAGIHHVWVNATGNWAYFVDELDRMAWSRLLVHTLDRRSWVCLAFCQMTTHVHLLLSIPDDSLSLGMRDLNREYAVAFNLRHGRVGTFVRKRFGSRRVEGGADLLGAFVYVVLNPVREGMCARAEHWYWSSYRTTVGLSRDFPFVDASIVIAEAGGSLDALRALVDGRSAARLLELPGAEGVAGASVRLLSA